MNRSNSNIRIPYVKTSDNSSINTAVGPDSNAVRNSNGNPGIADANSPDPIPSVIVSAPSQATNNSQSPVDGKKRTKSLNRAQTTKHPAKTDPNSENSKPLGNRKIQHRRLRTRPTVTNSPIVQNARPTQVSDKKYEELASAVNDLKKSLNKTAGFSRVADGRQHRTLGSRLRSKTYQRSRSSTPSSSGKHTKGTLSFNRAEKIQQFQEKAFAKTIKSFRPIQEDQYLFTQWDMVGEVKLGDTVAEDVFSPDTFNAVAATEVGDVMGQFATTSDVLAMTGPAAKAVVGPRASIRKFNAIKDQLPEAAAGIHAGGTNVSKNQKDAALLLSAMDIQTQLKDDTTRYNQIVGGLRDAGIQPNSDATTITVDAVKAAGDIGSEVAGEITKSFTGGSGLLDMLNGGGELVLRDKQKLNAKRLEQTIGQITTINPNLNLNSPKTKYLLSVLKNHAALLQKDASFELGAASIRLIKGTSNVATAGAGIAIAAGAAGISAAAPIVLPVVAGVTSVVYLSVAAAKLSHRSHLAHVYNLEQRAANYITQRYSQAEIEQQITDNQQATANGQHVQLYVLNAPRGHLHYPDKATGGGFSDGNYIIATDPAPNIFLALKSMAQDLPPLDGLYSTGGNDEVEELLATLVAGMHTKGTKNPGERATFDDEFKTNYNQILMAIRLARIASGAQKGVEAQQAYMESFIAKLFTVPYLGKNDLKEFPGAYLDMTRNTISNLKNPFPDPPNSKANDSSDATVKANRQAAKRCATELFKTVRPEKYLQAMGAIKINIGSLLKEIENVKGSEGNKIADDVKHAYESTLGLAKALGEIQPIPLPSAKFRDEQLLNAEKRTTDYSGDMEHNAQVAINAIDEFLELMRGKLSAVLGGDRNGKLVQTLNNLQVVSDLIKHEVERNRHMERVRGEGPRKFAIGLDAISSAMITRIKSSERIPQTEWNLCEKLNKKVNGILEKAAQASKYLNNPKETSGKSSLKKLNEKYGVQGSAQSFFTYAAELEGMMSKFEKDIKGIGRESHGGVQASFAPYQTMQDQVKEQVENLRQIGLALLENEQSINGYVKHALQRVSVVASELIVENMPPLAAVTRQRVAAEKDMENVIKDQYTDENVSQLKIDHIKDGLLDAFAREQLFPQVKAMVDNYIYFRDLELAMLGILIADVAESELGHKFQEMNAAIEQNLGGTIAATTSTSRYTTFSDRSRDPAHRDAISQLSVQKKRINVKGTHIGDMELGITKNISIENKEGKVINYGYVIHHPKEAVMAAMFGRKETPILVHYNDKNLFHAAQMGSQCGLHTYNNFMMFKKKNDPNCLLSENMLRGHLRSQGLDADVIADRMRLVELTTLMSYHNREFPNEAPLSVMNCGFTEKGEEFGVLPVDGHNPRHVYADEFNQKIQKINTKNEVALTMNFTGSDDQSLAHTLTIIRRDGKFYAMDSRSPDLQKIGSETAGMTMWQAIKQFHRDSIPYDMEMAVMWSEGNDNDQYQDINWNGPMVNVSRTISDIQM